MSQDNSSDLDFTKLFSATTTVAEPIQSVAEAAKLNEEAVIGESKLTSNGYFVRLFPDAPKRKPQHTPPLVLIVEDDDVTGMIIERVMIMNKFQVKRATNRAQIVDGIKMRPDLVLLDVMLPDANGFDILNRIRSHDKMADLPVLMLSSLGALDDILKGLKLGANGYLTKPAKSKALLDAIKNVLA